MSAKFWEIAVDDCTVTARYDRIGTNGTAKPKDFSSSAAANAHAEKLIQQKSAKGYAQSRNHS